MHFPLPFYFVVITLCPKFFLMLVLSWNTAKLNYSISPELAIPLTPPLICHP